EVIADRIGPAAGTVERLDDRTCVLHTGADTVETLAVHLGLLGADFDVTGPPELLTHLRRLVHRYIRAITSSAPGDRTG
ncbi:DNA-binding transcriptional regulator, partial [Nonomuraea sp. NPDC049784]